MNHGYSGYTHHGCRCQVCKTARYRYAKAARTGTTTPAYIDATGTRRRIQALNAMGWSYAHLATLLGYRSPQAVARLTTTPRVHRDNATKVATLFRQIGMTPGPSEHARKMARTAGTPGPLAWDDIDNPTETPNTGRRTIRPGGAGYTITDIEDLLEQDTWTATTLAARLGVQRGSLITRLRRHRRYDLLRRLWATDDTTTAHPADRNPAA